jgi:KUP system potassium uptake protein
MQEQVVLVTVTTERVPEIAAMERHRVERLTTDLSRVILRYGFLETPEVPNALAPALKELGIETPPDQLVYLLGRETLVISKEGRMGRVSEAVFALLSRHVRGVSDYFSLPAKQVVELGMQLDL